MEKVLTLCHFVDKMKRNRFHIYKSTKYEIKIKIVNEATKQKKVFYFNSIGKMDCSTY